MTDEKIDTADPLAEAIARTILRHQLGCDQPAEPPAWMVAAAAEIVDAIADGCRRNIIVQRIDRCLCVEIEHELSRRLR